MAVAISQTANPAGVSAASTVATYSGVSIGTAAADRIVVVVVATELNNSTPSACTIGGVAMSAGTTGNFGAVYTRIFYKLVPTGTTADIAVTFSSVSPSDTQNHIAVYKVTGANFSSSGGDGTTDAQDDLLTTGSSTIPSNGGMIAVMGGATDTTARTWSNLNEDIDADAGALRFSTATSTTAGTATRTVGGANNEDGAMSWIIFDVSVAPTVTTQAVSSIAQTTATGNGTVTADGGSEVTERGVVVNTTGTPTTADSKFTAAAGGTGVFTASITGRTANTHYYVRAYAINAIGTSYGSQVEFDTLGISVSTNASVQSIAISVGAVTVTTTRNATISPAVQVIQVLRQTPTVSTVRNATIVVNVLSTSIVLPLAPIEIDTSTATNVGVIAVSIPTPTVNAEVVAPEAPATTTTGGKNKSAHSQGYSSPEFKKKKKRSKAATEYIDKLEVLIVKTGVVKNTHKPYNPKTNKRFKVPLAQAERIAYSIAKTEGKKVGKFRHSKAALKK